jgi:4-amino-4-deoxy-L-arabinose transferase-like glycosyltransferase
MAKRKPRRARTPPPRGAAPTHRTELRTGLIFSVAVLVRLAYLLSIRDAYFFQHPQTEALHYHEWARLILGGSGAPAAPFEQAPGYPYFVAAIYALLGPRPVAVAGAQILLDTCTCLLVARLAGGWFGSRAGLLAGLLAAAYGPLVYFSAQLLPATAFVFLVLAAMAAALSAGAAPPPRRGAAPATADWPWALAACLWGLALCVRSEAVLAFPVVLFDAGRRGGRRALLAMALVLTAFLAVPLALNSTRSGRFVPFTTSDGVNLWLGNNPHADGVNPFVYGPLSDVDAIVRTHAADAVDADQRFRARALDFWQTQPAAAGWLLWKKFLWTWTDRELPNTSDIEWETTQSWLFRFPWLPLRFGAILPLALVGIVLLGGGLLPCTLLAAPVAIGLGTSLLFFTNARFRLVLVPALLVLAAAALDRLPRLGRERPARIAVAVLAAVLGLYAAWGDPYGVRRYRVPQILVNTGILEREAGHFDAAIQLLRDGLRDDPHDDIGWIHLALALEQSGRSGEALQAYFSALALADSSDAREMAARFFVRHGLDATLVDAYLAAPNATVRTDIAAQAARRLGHHAPPADR